MIEAPHMGNTERTLGDLFAEIKDEVLELLQTGHSSVPKCRELCVLKEGRHIWSAGIHILGAAYLLLTLALVGLVAVAFWGVPMHGSFPS
jgi:hypothetical protein